MVYSPILFLCDGGFSCTYFCAAADVYMCVEDEKRSGLNAAAAAAAAGVY